MNNLKHNIRYEIDFIKYTKLIRYMIFAIVIVFVLNINTLNKTFNVLNKTFQSTVKEVEKNGDDVEKLLNDDFYVREVIQEDGSILLQIDNIVRYDYEQLKLQYDKMQPTNIFFEVLKNSTLIFLPIIAGLFAIYISTYEFSSNTLKTRILNGTTETVFLSKVLSTVIVFTIVFVLSAIIGLFISVVWSSIVNLGIDISFILPKQSLFNIVINTFKALLIAYLISIVFLVIGFGLGIISSRFSVALGIFLLYHLVVPNLGKYDIKNLIMNLYYLVFNPEIGVSIINFSELNIPTVGSLITITVLLFLITGFIKFREMSKYTVWNKTVNLYC